MAEENLEEEVETLDVEEADADDSEEQEELSDEELDRIADTAIAALQDILKYFNVGEVTIDEYEGDDGELILDITGDDLAVLIGRHGKTLDALQFLVSAITVRTIGFRYPVVIDVEGYKSRQRQKLESIARSSANRAASQHRSVKASSHDAVRASIGAYRPSGRRSCRDGFGRRRQRASCCHHTCLVIVSRVNTMTAPMMGVVFYVDDDGGKALGGVQGHVG